MPKDAQEALLAAATLKTNLDFAAKSRWRVRAIMDGGAGAIRAMLGSAMDDEDIEIEDLPWANWMFSALNKLGQKIGQYPKIRVDPPETTDAEAAYERAEKRRRAVGGFDQMDRMELQLPQLGRWLPGYGYGVWTIGARTNSDGVPYPKATLRDPFDCYPGEWGVEQQPEELAVYRVIDPEKAKKLYPGAAEALNKLPSAQRQRAHGGAVILSHNSSGWANQRGRGIDIVEYYDAEGIHILIPSIDAKVAYIPNPLETGPAFVIPKRFAFNQLVGQYDHSIGLMTAGAKIGMLAIIAMEDGVMTETNITGEVVGGKRYRKGRNAINYLSPGTKVDKPASNIPYQTFEHLNRVERAFRNVVSYPVQDDAQSPLNFATGAGLEELISTVSLEVREYHKVLRWGLQDVDAKRLEWDEAVSPLRRKTIGGVKANVPHAETYKPAKDFKGDHATRRSHGLMSGWDDSAKIVGGIQMLEAEVLDVLTFQENIDGFDEITQMNERIRDKKARDALYQGLIATAVNGDLRAIELLIELQPEGEEKELLKKYYMPGQPEMTPEEEEFLARGGAPGGDPIGDLFANGDPPVSTVLSRLTGAGAQGGVQTVAEF